MDQRQRQITEGAGLEESRLNTEFIDWLNKWSTPILVVILVVAAGWWASRWWQGEQKRALNDAFAQFNEAEKAGKPDNLLLVAKEVGDRAAIAELATLRAADEYLRAARSNVAPGGDPRVKADIVAAEQKNEFLRQAGELYARALGMTRGKPDLIHQQISARTGQIAVLLDLGETDRARELTEELVEVARQAVMPQLAEFHEKRLAELDAALAQPPLPFQDSVAARFKEPEPAQAPGAPAPGGVIQAPGGEDMIVPLRLPQTPEQAPAAELPTEAAPPAQEPKPQPE